ncbi:MAG: phage holin family protein [Adlercreutzia equolifaciens]
MNFIIRWIVTAIAVRRRVDRARHRDRQHRRVCGIVLFALILSLINMSVKPILQVLSLPVTVLTLGIFYIVVNTLLLYIAAWLANGLFGAGFYIASFGSAFVASIVISIVSALVNGLVGNDN